MPELRDIKAGDIMTRSLVTLLPEAKLRDAARTLAENRITGALVVDGSGRPIGVLSTSDIVNYDAEKEVEGETAASDFYQRPMPLVEDMDDYSEVDQDLDWTNAPGHDVTVADRMTGRVISVRAAAALPELARTMVQERIHRVFVSDGRRIVGIVSSSDVVRAVSQL